MTKKKLKLWYELASSIQDKRKASTAKKALIAKRIHSFASGILVSDMDDNSLEELLERLIAFALILDYLDDIIEKDCLSYDQALSLNEALVQPLDKMNRKPFICEPTKSLSENYLRKLINVAGTNLERTPSYSIVRLQILRYMNNFIKSQAISCKPRHERNNLYKKWASLHQKKSTELEWNEFAAIQASPLKSYALLRYAYRKSGTIDQVMLIINTYKWMGGINVLGDHIQDIEKDYRKGEINQISEFSSFDKAQISLRRMIDRADQSIKLLDNNQYHKNILLVLVNMYMKPLINDRSWGKMAREMCNKYLFPEKIDLGIT